MTQTVLILGGSGKIGSHAADAFWNAGWNVRHFDRKTDNMTEAAMGCDVIVNGLNPPNYHDWDNIIPAITADVIAAAKASGATVILPGNLYNYGNQPGALSERTPHQPCSRKGQIRVDMEKAYRAAGVQTIILRAGNFICPDHNNDVMSNFILRDAKSLKIAHGGDPMVRQSYAYVPDWAQAARMLAEKREELGPFEDITLPGHNFTIEEMRQHLTAATGKDFKLTAFPWWIMSVTSPFWELARELREMRYLFEMDHWTESDRFDDLLPDFQATPLAEVMEAGLPADIHPNQTVRSGGQPIAAE